MANAKKCDICGAYFDMPEFNPYRLNYDENLNYIRLHKAKDYDEEDPWLHFDTCEKCYSDLLDYIIGKAATCAGDAE